MRMCPVCCLVEEARVNVLLWMYTKPEWVSEKSWPNGSGSRALSAPLTLTHRGAEDVAYTSLRQPAAPTPTPSVRIWGQGLTLVPSPPTASSLSSPPLSSPPCAPSRAPSCPTGELKTKDRPTSTFTALLVCGRCCKCNFQLHSVNKLPKTR